MDEQKANWIMFINMKVKEIMKDCPYELSFSVNHFFGHDDFVTEMEIGDREEVYHGTL